MVFGQWYVHDWCGSSLPIVQQLSYRARQRLTLACFFTPILSLMQMVDQAALVAQSADYHRLAFQRRIEQFFHRDEESVHIDVEDNAW